MTDLSARFETAQTLALEWHRAQRRKGTTIPYYAHLMAVTALVLEYGGSEDQAIAALLHDAVEDAGGMPTLERIRQAFGAEVTEIVWACTDADTTPKPPFIERKRAYHEHLERAPEVALLVSAADKLHNLESLIRDYRHLGPSLWNRFVRDSSSLEEKRDLTLWNYRCLLRVFKARLENDIVAQLERQLLRLEELMSQRADDAQALPA